MGARQRISAIAGIADHYGWAVAVTVGDGGAVVDRRRAELIDPSLPASPFEHDAQPLRIEDAITLIAEVERSIEQHVALLWDALEREHGISAVAIREIPELPPTVEERLRSYHAQTRADGAMYRQLLAANATKRGWAVQFYDHRRVSDEATGTLGLGPDHLAAPRRALGAPWTSDHRSAYAAALLAQHDLGG